jgi:hypothetical protein
VPHPRLATPPTHYCPKPTGSGKESIAKVDTKSRGNASSLTKGAAHQDNAAPFKLTKISRMEMEVFRLEEVLKNAFRLCD